jgi:hypothetical protein
MEMIGQQPKVIPSNVNAITHMIDTSSKVVNGVVNDV